MRSLPPLALLALGLCAAPALADEASATAREAQAPAAPPATARPAMIAPRAPHSILLSVAHAGAGLVAVGERGHILTSGNGRDWKQVPSPADVMLNRVRFRDDKIGFAVGHDATILATHDGGSTWALVHFDPASRPLYDVFFLDDRHFAAIGGYGTWLDSTDGGASWNARSFPIGDLGQHFNAVATLADGTLLVVGEKGLMMRSHDRGANWEMLDSPYTGSFFGVLPYGGKGALVYGLRGHVYVSDDVSACKVLKVEGYDPYTRQSAADEARVKALGWRTVGVATLESLFGGAASGGGVILVGVNGTVLRVNPATGTASEPRTPDGETLADVIAVDSHWLGVGRRGAIDLGQLK